MDTPIGAPARAFLRRVALADGSYRATDAADIEIGAICIRAGLAVRPSSAPFYLITPKGIDYLDRLARCE
ncbi:MAG: hypothetical protein E6Q76_14045 [Rhizobium sp.]|nr:MAG: hypothetical protein E6Q76_14045 [Rhizobium sp.]